MSKKNISVNLLNKELNIFDDLSLTVHYRRLFEMICMNRFIWKNLPNGISSEFIEKYLMLDGEIAIINHDLLGLMAVHCIGEGVNSYDMPTRYFCYTTDNLVNEYYDYDSKDLVIIRNNILSQPTYEFINRYAQNIAEIARTKDLNIKGQKTPYIIQCNENQKLSFEKILDEIENGKPQIYVKENVDMEGISVFNTLTPFVADKLQLEKKNEIDECLQFLGINTAIQKKERLITDEVNANNDLVNICLSIFMNTRLKGIDEANQKFGCNMEFELADYCKEQFKPKEVIENE